jgi:hypothetical protein
MVSVSLSLHVPLTSIADYQCLGVIQRSTHAGILNNINASRDDTWWYWIVLGSEFVVFRLVALLVLRLKASRFY